MGELKMLEDPTETARREKTDSSVPATRDAAKVLEQWWLTLAGNDYDRIQRAKRGRSK
jgi:hypothetical protein